MTRKEQIKIVDDKIKANNAQYELDRINAEISAYSSGDLPKFEYLTKKDLGYKPDAFEQAKFEYSSLGKVFIDGLDKSNRKEGLLKRLKNIEDRNNNQLLALNNIVRPAIKGKNNGGFRSDDDDYNNEYNSIQDFKKELIDKNILHIDGIKIFDNIINKWTQSKDKEIIYINDTNKVDTRNFDIYEIFKEHLNKNIKYKDIDGILNNIRKAVELYQRKPKFSDKNKSIINNANKVINGLELIKSLIDDDNFRIPGKYYAKPISNIDLSRINDTGGYKYIAEEAGSDYMKGNDDNELKLIKHFITKINNGVINNKNKAGNQLRKLKQKVTNDRLGQDIIKDLERYLFGEDIENIEPEEGYEESIAERVKTRQNKENDRDTQITFAPQDSSINLDDFACGENYHELDEEDREILGNMNNEGRVLKILSKQQMLSHLPILLAQIQAGNNSQSLKNEIRQLI